MKAMTFSRFGGSGVLDETDLALPVAGPREVLVRVGAAGVNPVDLAVCAGRLEAMIPTTFPAVPGWDVAGTVEAVGDGVDEFTPGDQVWGYLRREVVRYGTYAAFVNARADSLGIRPANISVTAAGALPLVGLTALQSLRAVGVGPGDTVLIGSAGGGVGHVAVQVARALGAGRVLATAGAATRDFVRGLGAEAVEYGPGVVQVVRALAPGGVDAAFDLHGGEALDAAFALVDDPARVVSIADPGVTDRGGQYIFCEPSRRDLDQLSVWVRSGDLRVQVAEVVPLSEARRAQDLVATGHTRGKVVLQM